MKQEKIIVMLKNWLDKEFNPNLIDDILEFLWDNDLLNDNGRTFRNIFWRTYIKNKKVRK